LFWYLIADASPFTRRTNKSPPGDGWRLVFNVFTTQPATSGESLDYNVVAKFGGRVDIQKETSLPRFSLSAKAKEAFS
jgi:hypothetical protein